VIVAAAVRPDRLELAGGEAVAHAGDRAEDRGGAAVRADPIERLLAGRELIGILHF